MRTITISGNLGKDPEVRETQSGQRVANFSVAVRRNRPDENGEYGTDWFRCTVWGSRVNRIERFYRKGSRGVFSGNLEVTEYNGKTQLGVSVVDFDLPDRESSRPQNGKTQSEQRSPKDGTIDIQDDDLPF